MATQTDNIGLEMAAGTEHYSVDLVNRNLEAIDDALGTLQNAVGSGDGTTLADKIGESTDTIEGTVFGDLSVIDGKAAANGAAIANVKTVADANAVKLNNLKTVTDNTKTVSDIVNTNIETVKQNVATILTRTETINTNAAKTTGIDSKIGTSSDTGDTTLFGIVNQLKTSLASATSALASANANIATLLTRGGGIKAIYTGSHTMPSANPATYVVTIPATMNPDKVVILTSSGKAPSIGLSGIGWQKDGSLITFYAWNNTQFGYQLVEFY